MKKGHGESSNPLFLDYSVSEQILFGTTTNEKFDLTGAGGTAALGYGPVSASYGVDRWKNPGTQIYGIGPAAGIKYTGGVVKTTTYTFPVYIFRMTGILFLWK